MEVEEAGSAVETAAVAGVTVEAAVAMAVVAEGATSDIQILAPGFYSRSIRTRIIITFPLRTAVAEPDASGRPSGFRPTP